MAKKPTKIQSVDQAAMFLISRSQRPITLEAEVANKQITKFVKYYEQWTGEPATWSELVEMGYAFDCGQGKWGSEYRIYFVKDQTVRNQLERYGCMVEDGDVRRKGTFRVNSRELFEELVVGHGFKLGENF